MPGFTWDGRTCELPELMLGPAREYFLAAEEGDKAAEGGRVVATFDARLEQLKHAGVSQGVVDSCPAARLGELLAAVHSALFPDAEGDTGNPEAGE